MTTLKELKDGAPLPPPLYKEEPYVVLSGTNAVLFSGTLEEIKETNTSYYDDCIVQVRKHDLYLNDNTRVSPPTEDKDVSAPEPPETVLSSWNKAQLERLVSNYNPEHDINTSATAPPVSWKELALAKSLLKAAEYMAGLEDRIAELELEAQLSKTDTDY